ncbi:BrnT family toxin [Myxococcota bacterium]|nr:BrnT family toxin [Myxococcota bacterium]
MFYEWDDAKAADNVRKHGVAFVDAVLAIEEIDDHCDYGEDRIQTIGMSRDRVLFVVTTLRAPDTCRIISARKATRNEQVRYHANLRQTW